MKPVAIVLAMVYVLAAVVQYNDPDPVRWIAIYAAAAFLCVASLFLPLPGLTYVLVSLTAFVWAVTLYVNASGGNVAFDAEVQREMGGLLLVAIGSVVLLMTRGGNGDADRESGPH